MKKFGAKKSILMGDLLIVKAIDTLLSIFSDDKFAQNCIIHQCAKTAQGAFLERELNVYSSVQNCLSVASFKTGALFELVCFLSSYLSAPSGVPEASSFGRSFGVMFQFQNDLDCFYYQDCLDSEDFVQKNITLPLIFLRDLYNINLETIFVLNQSTYSKVRTLIQSSEFRDYALLHLSNFTRRVSDFLYSLHPNFSSHY